MICPSCRDTHWVCENHPDRPWSDGGHPDACTLCGGAGATCPTCNPLGLCPPLAAGEVLLWGRVPTLAEEAAVRDFASGYGVD